MNKKYVFITGISSGFGFEITKKLLERNYTVIGSLRSGSERGHQIYSDFKNKIDSQQLRFVDIHLDKKESLDAGLEKIIPHLPEGLDILINNAGYGLLGPIELQSEQQIREQFETNFFAPVFIIQKLLPLLRKRQGRILNLSSLVGFTVFPYYGTYAASKHAIDVLSEALFYELESLGVQICAIEPGGYRTRFTPNARAALVDHPEARHYLERTKRFNGFLDFVQSKIEKDPIVVVSVIISLCEKERIPVRVQVGLESHLNWILKKISPDQWRIKIQNWIYKKFLF